MLNNNLPNLISSYSTFDINYSNKNPQRKQLYDEVIKLKKQINNLYSKISLIKSDNQKKEGEILLKEKEIGNFFEDNKISNNLTVSRKIRKSKFNL